MYNWNDGTDVLVHHGIKGQKWGQRRYQNEDGSLTAAGKERYGYTGEVRNTNVKEYAKDRRKRIKAEAEAIKSSKVSNREKAKALKKLGKHDDSAEYYKKDYVNKKRALVIGNIAYQVAAKAGAQYIAKKVGSGQMSFQTGANIALATNIGKKAVNAYLLGSMYDDRKNYNKEYWNFS